jgi:hypothetical protein
MKTHIATQHARIRSEYQRLRQRGVPAIDCCFRIAADQVVNPFGYSAEYVRDIATRKNPTRSGKIIRSLVQLG